MAKSDTTSGSGESRAVQGSQKRQSSGENSDQGKSDFAELQDQVAQLGSSIGQLAQSRAEAVRKQVAETAAGAGATLSEQAESAQEAARSFERDVERRIRRNPWSAVAIAAGLGFLLAKMP